MTALDFSWLPAEWPGAVQALLVTLGRLLLSLGLGLGGGALLAAVMRRSPRIEAFLTPWLLTLLAVPWVLILISLNLIPSLGVRDGTAITVAAIAALASGAKQLAVRLASARTGTVTLLLSALEVLAALIVVLFGLALTTGYLVLERMMPF